MIYLDLALRGGAVTLLLLLAALLWRAPVGWEGRMSVTALAVTKSAFLITSTAMPVSFHPSLGAILITLSSLTPVAVTWLIVAIFLDAPGRRWPWLTASMATSVALYAHLTIPGTAPFCLPMGVVLYGALVGLSLWSTRDDLVECRCAARPGFAAAIAGLALFLTLGQATGALQQDSVLLALLQATGILAVALAFAVWLLHPDADRWPGETSAQNAPPSPIREGFGDSALIARIKAAMNARIWQEEGLTIGALAARLGVPEHRLRRAINQGLGYRNFSSFINHARIEAACAALSDPAHLHETIAEIAYDVGFSSVGPFNRAFRLEVGQSPTEYRRMTQSDACADSEESSPIAANLH